MLSIITVSYKDLAGLEATIESVKAQSAVAMQNTQSRVQHIVVMSGYPEEIRESVMASHSAPWVSYIVDRDTGLYNAMNAGLSAATGTHALFLNGGDRFHDASALDTLLASLRPGTIGLFRVIQHIGNQRFVRPGRAGPKVRYSHQGFVAPLDDRTPRFDETLEINADTQWMRICLDLYLVEHHEAIITAFALGGRSNRPGIWTIGTRYRTNGLARATLEVYKLAMYKVLGEQRYYRLLAKRAKYDEI